LHPDKPVIVFSTEPDVLSWASDELKDLCDFTGKMYVDISKASGMSGWDDADADLTNLLTELRNQLQPLYKVLKGLGCPKSLLLEGSLEQDDDESSAVVSRLLSSVTSLSTDALTARGSSIGTKSSSIN
jgi:hypothetical protein